MKTIPAALKSHFGDDLSTVASCWKLTRPDGQAFYFTDHDTDLTIDDEVYEAAAGFMPKAVAQAAGLEVDNTEAETFLDSDKITEPDIQAGRYDYATIDLFLVNYEALDDGKFYLLSGWSLGEVEIRDRSAKAEIRGKAQRLQRQVVEVYTPSCRAKLGDERCTVDLGSVSVGTAGSRIKILRHFEPADMLVPMTNYGPFDGFVYGNFGEEGGAHLEVMRELRAGGKRPFAYFEVLTFPVESYEGPWWTWWKNYRDDNGLGLVNDSAEPAYFETASLPQRQFVDWSLVTAAQRREILEKMFELSEDNGLFFDQAWLEEAPYFFFCNYEFGPHGDSADDGHARYEDFDNDKWVAWQSSIYQFYVLADQMAAERGVYVIKNGEHFTKRGQTIPEPVLWEDSVGNNLYDAAYGAHDHLAAEIAAEWEAADKHSVVSMIVFDLPDPLPAEIPFLVATLQASNKAEAWVSFTGADAQTAGTPSPHLNEAYEETHTGRTTEISPYRHSGAVESITEDRRVFVDSSSVGVGGGGFSASDPLSQVFKHGLLFWFDGLNAGLEMEVKAWDPEYGEFELFQAMPFEINVGDTFSVTFGCDKRLETCRERFGNAVNFRGEPYVPGADELARIYMP